MDKVKATLESILVIVDGGVAHVVEGTVPPGFMVEIIDFDNLTDMEMGDSVPKFSSCALEYIERESRSIAAVIKAKQSI